MKKLRHHCHPMYYAICTETPVFWKDIMSECSNQNEMSNSLRYEIQWLKNSTNTTFAITACSLPNRRTNAVDFPGHSQTLRQLNGANSRNCKLSSEWNH